MPELDDDVPSARPSSTFLHVVHPGRPATFVGDGCLLLVERDGLAFDLAFRGSLVTRNQHVIGRILMVAVDHAERITVSLGGLDELDGAGAVMIENAATVATRRRVHWTVLDGDLAWQLALRGAASPTPTKPPASRVARKRPVASRRERAWTSALPISSSSPTV